MSADELITDAWLLANGWKLASPRNDVNMQLPGFRLRPIAWECKDGPPPFVSHDDLCIAVAPSIDATPAGDGASVPAYWFVWVYHLEPYRFIHVRHMRHTWELKQLWEGLTGRRWPNVSEAVPTEPPDENAVHDWFGLTYASYLVLPRCVMQSMPAEWQARMVHLLEEAGEKFGSHYGSNEYRVRLVVDGEVAVDPLADYRHNRLS